MSEVQIKVEHNGKREAPLTELLSAVADPVRLRLASLLAHNGEPCVCDLVDATGLTQTNVSRHLHIAPCRTCHGSEARIVGVLLFK